MCKCSNPITCLTFRTSFLSIMTQIIKRYFTYIHFLIVYNNKFKNYLLRKEHLMQNNDQNEVKN